MQAREDFHKAGRAQALSRFAALALVVSLACAGDDAAPPVPTDSSMIAEPAPTSGPRPPAGHAWVVFGADTVLAEVAATAEEREQGLMYRDDVPDGTGMLFVFPDFSVRSFWMANTYVPLDIAFLDTQFNVVDVIQMQPLVRESYTSRAPAMYGLEVRQGWFAEHGIAVGDRAEVVFGVMRR